MGLAQTIIEAGVETSPQLIESLHMAREVALKSDVAEVLPAHLVLAMLKDDESSFLLDAYGVDFIKVRTQLGKIVQTQVKPKSSDRHAVFSAGIETIMQHAREQAQKNALAEVDSNLILAVILSEKNGFLGGMLAPYDLDTSGVLQYLELREGKTVNIDPLPSLPNSKNAAGKNTPATANRPAPNPVPGPAPSPVAAPRGAPVPQATHQAPPLARPTASEPIANHQATNTPVAHQQSGMQVPQGEPATKRPNAPIPKPSLSQPPSSPMPAPSAHQNQTPSTQQQSPIQEFAEQADNLQRPVTKNDHPSSLVSTPTVSPAANQTSSRLNSMLGKIGKIGKRLKGYATKSETAPSPQNAPTQNAPIQAPTMLAQTPANNNQSPSGSKTNVMPSNEPVIATDQKRSPQQASAPARASVDHLVAADRTAQIDARTTPASPAPLNPQNRPAKRRRAVPASLGSNESLSATGSVLEKGRLVEAVPRKMKMNKPSRAEVRITRDQLEEINSEFEVLSASHIHDLAVTEAMTVQLRAPGSGFHIENLSPQTQWIDRNQRHINDADFGVWRWNVTPIKPGKSRLQLVISARTVDDDGNIHIADIPDKVIELSVARNYGKGMKRIGFSSLLVIASLALGRYGEVAWQWGSTLVSKLGL